MKKIVFLLVLLTACRFIASAQNCGANFLGTKALYKNTTHHYTPAPAGYRPVFINHVGRHGARHLTKDVKTTSAYALLWKADSLDALTTDGKKLKQMVIALQKIEKGNTKFISVEGKEELKGLGERMYVNYAPVFANKPHVKVAITKEIRTKQSADAFLSGLNGNLTDTVVTDFYNDDTNLRFYDLSPAYKSFEDDVDDAVMESTLKKADDIEGLDKVVTARFFTADFLKKLDASRMGKFIDDVFGFATIVYSLKAEIKQAGYKADDVDFKSFFTCNELQKLGDVDSADENLKKGPGADANGIQVRIAAPLLADFINTSDEYLKTGKYNARLRFAHAETVAPFAALLQISVADKTAGTADELNKKWQSSAVIPLSANILWVFYKRQDTPGYFVKVLLNEKEVHIDGLKTSTFPYYKWSDLRSFYSSKLVRLHVKLTDDMNTYLSGLK